MELNKSNIEQNLWEIINRMADRVDTISDPYQYVKASQALVECVITYRNRFGYQSASEQVNNQEATNSSPASSTNQQAQSNQQSNQQAQDNPSTQGNSNNATPSDGLPIIYYDQNGLIQYTPEFIDKVTAGNVKIGTSKEPIVLHMKHLTFFQNYANKVGRANIDKTFCVFSNNSYKTVDGATERIGVQFIVSLIRKVSQQQQQNGNNK